LPIVYESRADIHRRREKMLAHVEQLFRDGVTIDTTRTLVPTSFFSVYQGQNDRGLHSNLGQIYRGVDFNSGRRIDGSRRRLRVGFLSAYFRDHTIGRLNLGRIRHLPRERFEAVVLSVGRHDDAWANNFSKSADRYEVVPRDVSAARQLIADLGLDILFFTDVGMDALTYTLAFSRMAPVQCTTWGHPVTTGSPTMDYFISSELLEPPGGEEHYTEKLLRLPTLGTYYYRPRVAGQRRSRRDFGLDEGRPIYVCPQTLFKLHPQFDPVLADILRRDPDGQLVLIEGRAANWTRLLKERFAREMSDVADRIRWLPSLANQDFLNLLSLVDVALDPFPFGGGNTSYEALGMGTLVVTWPGAFLRGRITDGLYRKIGLDNLCVNSASEYVETAVTTAAQFSQSAACRDNLMQAADALFEDMKEVEDLASGLELMARENCR
jgi:predicted O-linked N-acetylglucosamine transferase (SPINDLY family)